MAAPTPRAGRRAFDQLEHEAAHTIRVLKAVDGADVWMIQRSE